MKEFIEDYFIPILIFILFVFTISVLLYLANQEYEITEKALNYGIDKNETIEIK